MFHTDSASRRHRRGAYRIRVQHHVGHCVVNRCRRRSPQPHRPSTSREDDVVGEPFGAGRGRRRVQRRRLLSPTPVVARRSESSAEAIFDASTCVVLQRTAGVRRGCGLCTARLCRCGRAGVLRPVREAAIAARVVGGDNLIRLPLPHPTAEDDHHTVRPRRSGRSWRGRTTVVRCHLVSITVLHLATTPFSPRLDTTGPLLYFRWMKFRLHCQSRRHRCPEKGLNHRTVRRVNARDGCEIHHSLRMTNR